MLVSQSTWIQLQSITYSEAIDRYKYLKQRFLWEYSNAAELTEDEIKNEFEKNIVDSIYNDLEKYINSSDVADLYREIEQLISDRIATNSNLQNSRKNIRKDYYAAKKYNQSITQAKQAAMELGELILPEEELEQIIRNKLIASGVGTGFSINDILAQMKGYRTKLIQTRTKAAKNYIRSTKGYFQEALVYKAFAQLEEHLDNKLSVLSAGHIKVDGKDTLYDTYIGFMKTLDDSMFKQVVSEKIDLGYGIQSKSWKAPWEVDKVGYFNEKYGFSLGGRMALLRSAGLDDALSTEASWLQGVQYLSLTQNLMQAIGENQVAFVTGQSFIWTYQLIEYFRALDYFLAFGYRPGKKLSSTISWIDVQPGASSS